MHTAAHPDVFISYARDDREAARRFAQWCVAAGWSVWWDQAIAPGRKWDQAIERALADAKCVLVLWSARSVASDWVKTEAAEAARRGVLVPVLIENVMLPLEFRRVQTLDLSAAWDRAAEPALELLRSALAEHIGRGPAPIPAAPVVPAPDPAPMQRRRMVAAAALVVAVGGALLWQAFPANTPRVAPVAVTAPSGLSGPSASSASSAPSTSSASSASATTVDAGPPRAPPRPSVAATGAAAPGPLRPLPAPLPQPGLAGGEVARLAEEQRQALIDKGDKSGLNWTPMLER